MWVDALLKNPHILEAELLSRSLVNILVKMDEYCQSLVPQLVDTFNYQIIKIIIIKKNE